VGFLRCCEREPHMFTPQLIRNQFARIERDQREYAADIGETMSSMGELNRESPAAERT
jgi:hypothetical protein